MRSFHEEINSNNQYLPSCLFSIELELENIVKHLNLSEVAFLLKYQSQTIKLHNI